MKKRLAILLTMCLAVSLGTGCGNLGGSGGSDTGEEDSETAGNSENTADTEEASQPVSSEGQTDEDMFTDRDYQEEDCVSITLSGTSASASSDSVQISGTTITITEEGDYLISGTLRDGMLIVNAPDTAKVRLVFDGVELNSETSAPLYIKEADKVVVTLAEGSENTLSNSGTYTAVDDSSIDAAIYSKQDLTFNGTGALTISSPGGHGIVSNDDLAVTGGAYTVTAASHGLKANDSVRITGDSQFILTAGKDGIHAENAEDSSLGFVYISDGTIEIEAEGDGISAGAYMQISDGTFQIQTGGGSENAAQESSESWGEFQGGDGPGGQGPGQRGESGEESSPVQTSTTVEGSASAEVSQSTEEDSSTSMKGMKAAGELWISGGSFTIDSADDSVHSNTSILVEDGVFEIASGDDAIHADETLTITAGTINISESYEGLEALNIEIQDGDIALAASDDGLNAAGGTDSSGIQGGRDGMFGGGVEAFSSSDGTVAITGGTLNINASGDGIDANGSIEISGGHTVVVGPSQGDTAALDYDTSAVITGGTFIGTGGAGMAQTFSESDQGVVSVNAGDQAAGTEVSLADSRGNVILSVTPELFFSVIIFSSPELVEGESYTLTVGTASEEVEAG